MKSIIRDFSLEAVEELREIIKKNVDEEDQFFLFDWFEDIFQMDDLDIKNYIDNVEEYHAQMIDKHNIDGEKFERILQRVHAVDINYANRLSSIGECMISFNEKIMNIADMITPSAIILEGKEYEKLVGDAKNNYNNAVYSMKNNIEEQEGAMPELRDIPWYESALNAVGGFGVSLLRDAIEGTAFLPYAIVDQIFGTDLNERLRSFLDNFEENYISPLVTDEKWYYRGRVAGDATCMVLGIAGMAKGVSTLLSGITIGGSGVAVSSTGVGAIYGIPAIAVSVPVVLVGTAEVAASAGILYAANKNYNKNLEKMNSAGKRSLDDVDLGKETEKLKQGINKLTKPEKLINDLSNYISKKWNVAGNEIILDKKGMKHILERHHPGYWDGSVKAEQSFLDKNLSIDDIQSIAGEIISKNRDIIISKGTRGMYQIEGEVNGIEYILGFKNGRIGQLYPK